MAKKKKITKSKSNKQKKETVTSPFWSYSAAIILFILAFFVLIGGFKSGGILPDTLFRGVYVVFGWAAYTIPIFLVYFGVYKFKTENHRIPLAYLISPIISLIFLSAGIFTIFAQRIGTGSYLQNSQGGYIGSLIGKLFLDILDKIPAAIMLLIVAVLGIFFAFSISPSIFITFFKFINRKRAEKNELEELTNKNKEVEFKLNEGVPIEHHNSNDEPINTPKRIYSFKNTAQKVSGIDNTSALTTDPDSEWKFPGISLLNQKVERADAGDVNGNVRIIKDTFLNFKINVEMEGANIGPRVTQYTLRPPADVKLTKITSLENNLALNLAAHSIRIEAPIPGKRAVGIEVPNVKPATVRLSSLLTSREWADLDKPLGFAIGKDISGKAVVGDLSAMPHLLIAGQTGSGKSVMINTVLTSLLYRNSPSDLKLILIDPKQVEMAVYGDLPHLLTPIINEPEKCISALKWAVKEMDRRLAAMATVGKKNIYEYNLGNKDNTRMPYIVIVIDELADLMMMAARDVEALIVRIAQKARAAGIHLVLATQRPSVDVITGLIKANIPARIAFTVASQVDSRTIIDQIGAEKLLGQGDMLLLTAEMPKPKRIQAGFMDNNESIKVTDFIRSQRPPNYNDDVVSQPVQIGSRNNLISNDFSDGENEDSMWEDAVKVVIENKKASTSLLQRRLRIGYGRAARIIETMEEKGIISTAQGSRPREVLISSIDEMYGDDSNMEMLAEDENVSENVEY